MKRYIPWFLVLLLTQAHYLFAQPGGARDKDGQDQKTSTETKEKPVEKRGVSKPMNHPAPSAAKPSPRGAGGGLERPSGAKNPPRQTFPAPAKRESGPQPGTGFSRPAARPNPPSRTEPRSAQPPAQQRLSPTDARRGNMTQPGREKGAPAVSDNRPAPQSQARTQPALPGRFQRLGITRVPEPIKDRSQWPDSRRERSVIQNPSRDERGEAFRPQTFSRLQMGRTEVRNHMRDVATSVLFQREMEHTRSMDNRANYYYWHTWNNHRYCHYTDRWGAHWYGWALGPRFFWTRYNAGYWWWYDPDFGRWCYWHNGWWWWHDPFHVNVVYVYTDGAYVSSNPAVEQPPAESASSRVYKSPDGTRMVKVLGSEEDAFLYDTSVPPDFQPVYLASGVEEVKYSGSTAGRRLQVLVLLRDGSFNLFDDRGNPDGGMGEPPQ